MSWSVFKYFISYILNARTRQKLLILSVLGLGLSSFSLTVLQGVMGGLQSGLIKRSKDVKGVGHIVVSGSSIAEVNSLKEKLNASDIDYISELRAELLIKNQNIVYPVLLHGIEANGRMPSFLNKIDFSNLVLGSDLGYSLNSFISDRVSLISPSTLDLMLIELPRQSAIEVSDFLSTNIPEVDSFEGWVRLSFLQNLLRTRSLSHLVLMDNESLIKAKELNLSSFSPHFKLYTWEQEHQTLVWALGLETKVMLFLFIGMCFLLGICIVSGNLIFYNQIKKDLASFWLLGLSKNAMMKLIKNFGQLITILFSALGVLLGYTFLKLLENSSLVLMPEYFVERNIPVNIEVMDLLLSFLVPYTLAGLFTYFTFKIFQSENYSLLKFVQKN